LALQAAFETRVFDRVRRATFPRFNFSALMVVLTVVGALFPLLLAGTTSYSDAQDICFERNFQAKAKTDHQRSFKDSPSSRLYPTELFYFISTSTSLVSALLWLYKSPHQSIPTAVAKRMDYECESPSFISLLAMPSCRNNAVCS
jgi:hypothetical protein